MEYRIAITSPRQQYQISKCRRRKNETFSFSLFCFLISLRVSVISVYIHAHMWKYTHTEVGRVCLASFSKTFCLISLRQGLFLNLGLNFSARLDTRKPPLSSCLRPTRSCGYRCLWRCPPCYVSSNAGLQDCGASPINY